jgi:hypothetical protein
VVSVAECGGSQRPKGAPGRERKKIMKIVSYFGLGIVAFSIFLFYEIFFKLTPYIGNLLPASAWTPFIKIALYFIVAYIGGVALPFMVFILGVYVFIMGLE